jgi:DNA polymerase V
MSRRVMQTLAQFTPAMEIYSIDEAFLCLTGVPDQLAHTLSIRDTIKKNTGIPVSIGLAPTKVLAKLANQIAKKNKNSTAGVFDLRNPSLHEKIMKDFPVGDIWGIGRKSAEKLERINIRTALQLRDANEKTIEKLLTITGRRIIEELRGISCNTLEVNAEDQKQILSSRSFGRPVYHLSDLKEAVANHITSAAEKLRSQQSICKNVTVFIQTNPHKNVPQYYNSAATHIHTGTSATNKLISIAFRILEKIYRNDYEYKKAGVILTDFHKKYPIQRDLFDEHDSERTDILMQTLDSVNKSDGNGTLKYAACGIDPFWKMASEMKSSNFTTKWSELLTVKI